MDQSAESLKNEIYMNQMIQPVVDKIAVGEKMFSYIIHDQK